MTCSIDIVSISTFLICIILMTYLCRSSEENYDEVAQRLYYLTPPRSVGDSGPTFVAEPRGVRLLNGKQT